MTRPPVVLEHWPVARAARSNRFTTVGSWRGTFGKIEIDGRSFGQKAHEFRKFVTLPLHRSYCFELALDIHPAEVSDLESLHANRWRLVDPYCASGDPEKFRDYVQGSSAEFSVAQGIYVDTNSGWFSDRTVRYLASGKPALVEDTGFSSTLPVGRGLIAFRTLDEAIAGADSIVEDYEAHCAAARRLAEDVFDAEKVLSALLRETGTV
jgi:hypothetical protein